MRFGIKWDRRFGRNIIFLKGLERFRSTRVTRVTLKKCYTNRRIVSGFEGEKNMPKLNFSGNLSNTIRNNILKLPVFPAGAVSNIQDGVQDGRQNINTTI